jgi:hypothetical protein
MVPALTPIVDIMKMHTIVYSPEMWANSWLMPKENRPSFLESSAPQVLHTSRVISCPALLPTKGISTPKQ